MPLKSVTLEKLERMQKEVSTKLLTLPSGWFETMFNDLQFRHKNSWNFKNQELSQKTLVLWLHNSRGLPISTVSNVHHYHYNVSTKLCTVLAHYTILNMKCEVNINSWMYSNWNVHRWKNRLAIIIAWSSNHYTINGRATVHRHKLWNWARSLILISIWMIITD